MSSSVQAAARPVRRAAAASLPHDVWLAAGLAVLAVVYAAAWPTEAPYRSVDAATLGDWPGSRSSRASPSAADGCGPQPRAPRL